MNTNNNLEVVASTGGLKVLDSGVILSAGVNESIVFNLVFFSFRFKLEFKFIDNDGKTYASISVEDDDKMIVTCENYNNSLGTGVKTPLKLTNSENENLYISYTIYKMSSDAGHKLQYTFYSK